MWEFLHNIAGAIVVVVSCVVGCWVLGVGHFAPGGGK